MTSTTSAHPEFATIRYERREGVGTLTLTRPAQRNAINPAMRRELTDLAEELAADDEIPCLVVAGDGSSFCSGIDQDAATSMRFAVQAQADCLRSPDFARARNALADRNQSSF